MQLLALLVEVVSIKVAGRQIKKPIDIDRPGKKTKGGQKRQNGQQREQQAARTPIPAAEPGATGASKAVGILMATRYKRG